MEWLDVLVYSFLYSVVISDYLDSVILIRKNLIRNIVKYGFWNIVLLVKNVRLIEIFLLWIKVLNIFFEYFCIWYDVYYCMDMLYCLFKICFIVDLYCI